MGTTDRAGLATAQVPANARACELLACTLEMLLGSVVGSRTTDGKATVERVVRGESRTGELEPERFDGETIRLSYLTFEARTAGLPYMASMI